MSNVTIITLYSFKVLLPMLLFTFFTFMFCVALTHSFHITYILIVLKMKCKSLNIFKEHFVSSKRNDFVESGTRTFILS